MKNFRRPSEIRFIHGMLLREHAKGISSKALALYALGMNPEIRRVDYHGGLEQGRNGLAYPHDAGDFSRCVETYKAAPRHLKRLMKPVLDAWGQAIEDGGGIARERRNP